MEEVQTDRRVDKKHKYDDRKLMTVCPKKHSLTEEN